MRLKVWTTGLVIFCGLLMVLWPVVIGLPPKGAPRRELAMYAIKSQIYVAVLLLSLLATAICAVYLIRAIREEYRRGAAEALREMIEGTLADHKGKGAPPDEQA